MTAIPLKLKEGQSTPYSVIAVNAEYAVVNWSVVPGNAQLGFDFEVDPLSGTNVIVEKRQTLEIDFSIIDDKRAGSGILDKAISGVSA